MKTKQNKTKQNKTKQTNKQTKNSKESVSSYIKGNWAYMLLF